MAEVQAHREIVNCIDGVGLNDGGSPLIATGKGGGGCRQGDEAVDSSWCSAGLKEGKRSVFLRNECTLGSISGNSYLKSGNMVNTLSFPLRIFTIVGNEKQSSCMKIIAVDGNWCSAGLEEGKGSVFLRS